MLGKVSINRTGFTLKCCNVAIQGFRFQWLKIFVPTGFLFKMLNRFPFFIGWNVCTCTGFPLKCLYMHRISIEMFVHAQGCHWNVCTCTGFSFLMAEMFVGAQGFRLNEWKDFYSGLLFLKTENVFTHRVSDENVWKGRNSGFPFLMAENIWNVWKGCNSAFPFLWM